MLKSLYFVKGYLITFLFLCHFKRIQKITWKNNNQRPQQCVTKGGGKSICKA